MGNKAIQMSRMWKYFVEATVEVIEEEGVEQVTIRKVADRAGYNSATMYNYFTEISHLIFFASMKLMKPYTKEVSTFMDKGKTPLEKYMMAWECFCKHSFKQPEIFHAVFIMDLGDQPDKLIENYYEIYPSELIDIPEELKPVLFQHNIKDRGRSILEAAVTEGQLKPTDVEKVNEMTILIWQGMLTNILNNRRDYDLKQATTITMDYITDIIHNAKVV